MVKKERQYLLTGSSTQSYGTSSAIWAHTALQRRRKRGGNGGARPRDAETARAKVSFRPCNNTPSLLVIQLIHFMVMCMNCCHSRKVLHSRTTVHRRAHLKNTACTKTLMAVGASLKELI